eukprot:5388073-Pyramimonas_sp.AAC.1
MCKVARYKSLAVETRRHSLVVASGRPHRYCTEWSDLGVGHSGTSIHRVASHVSCGGPAKAPRFRTCLNNTESLSLASGDLRSPLTG